MGRSGCRSAPPTRRRADVLTVARMAAIPRLSRADDLLRPTRLPQRRLRPRRLRIDLHLRLLHRQRSKGLPAIMNIPPVFAPFIAATKTPFAYLQNDYGF